MKISLLKPGDEELMHQAESVFNSEALSLVRCALLLREPSYVMVVARSDDAEVLGRIYGNVLHRYSATDLLLYEVDVVQTHQRKGVGRAMLEFLKALCEDRGYSEMWVLTELENAAGNAVYRSAGGVLENSPVNMYVFPIGKR